MEVAAVGLAISVAQTLFAALECSELKELFTSDLESLESLGRSVTTIKAVLLDADSKQANGTQLTAQEHDLIVKIKDVVYDADDLFEAYVTRAKLQHTRKGLRSLFKHSTFASREIKKTAKMLNEIGKNALNFKLESAPIRIRREETSSFVKEDYIVGREDDRKKIVDMLLHPITEGDLPVLAIVGIGGLGKTSLAQLVYNHPDIQKEFPLRLWVCVSDQDKNEFNKKKILADIYKSATREKSIGDMGLDVLQQELRTKLDQNKYLLVLDDLWSEKSDECRELVDILIGSVQRGSRIIVTTRSKRTADAIGSSQTYELRGLSDDDSWHLFELKVGREKANRDDLVEICKDIVKKCVNVPLAIKVVGSFLHGRPENEWQSFRQSRLLEIKKDDDDIMRILKFSYYHLSPSLKSCFTYCAIFPKDFGILKENLISMWMAHGYVKDEDDAEYHFQILVQRCFFHPIEENSEGYFSRGSKFTIHDLMHDMVQEVAGKEIFIANYDTTELDKKTRHLNSPASCTKGFVTPAKIRTFVCAENALDIQSVVSAVLANWKHLRVLDLRCFGIRQLPDAIGELVHLRHLDLYGNGKLKMLPKSLTKLINLQYLNLDGCRELKEFPRDFKNLVNLRTLYLPESYEFMLSGMANMTRLTRLNFFIVGNHKDLFKDKLGDLRVLRNLKGSLKIWFKQDYKHAEEYCGKGGYICNTQHLDSIYIRWYQEVDIDGMPVKEEGRVGNDEDLLEDLQPHRNLKKLSIEWYHGVSIPKWASEDSLTTSLPNLVRIKLANCNELKELPWLGRLQHLKILYISKMRNVEYMENRRSVGSSTDDGVVASNSSTALFFPSLKELKLKNMPKLKGWWSGMSNCTSGSGLGEDENKIRMVTTNAHPLPSFPCLSNLTTGTCQILTCIPRCPAVETLTFGEMTEEDEKRVENSGRQYSDVSFQCLINMNICRNNNVESLSELEEVLRVCSSSLRSLELKSCRKLRSVFQGGLEYLTALEQLYLFDLPELKFDETDENGEEEGTGTSTGISTCTWICLGKSLRSLTLGSLDKVVNLPTGMRYLTALQSLTIIHLPLKDIPEWIECLSSLQSLHISYCSSLESLPRELQKLTSLKKFYLIYCDDELHHRCEKPDGEYWHILEHIPHLYTRKS